MKRKHILKGVLVSNFINSFIKLPLTRGTFTTLSGCNSTMIDLQHATFEEGHNFYFFFCLAYKNIF